MILTFVNHIKIQNYFQMSSIPQIFFQKSNCHINNNKKILEFKWFIWWLMFMVFIVLSKILFCFQRSNCHINNNKKILEFKWFLWWLVFIVLLLLFWQHKDFNFFITIARYKTNIWAPKIMGLRSSHPLPIAQGRS
jgi:uncharacterized membrane protein